MKFKLNSDESLKIPFKIEKWYDRKTRSWVVELQDENNHQIGEAFYCATKPEAIAEEKRLKEEYKL